MRSRLEILRAIPLFHGLDEEAYHEIGHWIEVCTFPAEHYIFHQGEEADAVWIVAEGRVRMLRQASPGKEVILELLGPGEVFGGATILLSRNPATAQAATPVTVLRLPPPPIWSCWSATPVSRSACFKCWAAGWSTRCPSAPSSWRRSKAASPTCC